MAGKVMKFLNGYAGQVSRSIDDIIEAIPNGESSNAIPFGGVVALSSGKVMNVSGTYTDVIGVAVRSIKTEKTYGGDDAEYGVGEIVDVLKRGTVAMSVPHALTPAAGGTVYITKATGKLATAADSTNTIETKWKFKGPKDANDIVEVVIPERVY